MRQKPTAFLPFIILILALTASLAGACSRSTPTLTAAPSLPEDPPTPTIQPSITPTPAPMAARVNGEAVLLADYEAELNRLEASLSETGAELSAPERSKRVLDELIDQVLLAQGAYRNGYADTGLDERITALQQQIGGEAALSAWQTEHAYTEQSFRAALSREMAAAWQRDQIANGVPGSTEQVHARQILLLDAALAKQVHGMLKSGSDFATQAVKYDPLTGGELGWFPRGYLIQPAVDEAAFTLAPGQFSEIIETDYGYHIVQVVERGEHPLSPEARRFLQHQAVSDWLQGQRQQAQIELLITP